MKTPAAIEYGKAYRSLIFWIRARHHRGRYPDYAAKKAAAEARYSRASTILWLEEHPQG